MADYINDVFGARGLFAQRFPGYQERSGQMALTREVHRCLDEGGVVLGEAPCGTGKSMAVAVPAVWHAHNGRKPIVFATASITLQEQLVEKDLPLLAELLPWKFTFALLKGRQNFACLKKVADLAESRPPSLFPDDDRELDDLLAWVDKTSTGDRSELKKVPRETAWREISIGSEDCLGSRCSHSNVCFANRARATAAKADIIVTNYHILLTHLVLREMTGQDLLLPAFDTLIADEVHELPDIARDCLGWKITEGSLRRLARDATKHGLSGLEGLRANAGPLFAAFEAHARSPKYKARLRKEDRFEVSPVVSSLSRMGAHAAHVAEHIPGDSASDADLETKADLERICQRAERLSSHLGSLEGGSDSDVVRWLELDPQGRATLACAPVAPGPMLQRALFGRLRSCCLVSATLTTGGSFDFVKRELGLTDRPQELVVPSPFDFREQGLLVVPTDIPAPNDPHYLDALAEKVGEVIEIANGRTLCLFTSYRALNYVYDRVVGGKHRVLKQGDLPKTQLVDVFRRDVHSVLLGTTSFWTGVDVPGESLSALVIDKLPFPRLDDPVLDVLGERDGKAAFSRHHLPRCMMTLQQGVGRLIRSVDDRGVVVILDRRVLEKGYGRQILSSLPRMPRGSMAAIPSFLSGDPDAWAS